MIELIFSQLFIKEKLFQEMKKETTCFWNKDDGI